LSEQSAIPGLIFVGGVILTVYSLLYIRANGFPRLPKLRKPTVRGQFSFQKFTFNDYALAFCIFLMHLAGLILTGYIADWWYILPVTVPGHFLLLGFLRRQGEKDSKRKSYGLQRAAKKRPHGLIEWLVGK